MRIKAARSGPGETRARATERRCGMTSGHGHEGDADCCGGDHEHPAAARVTDPVCGMSVDPATSQHRCAHHGHSYYFCSAGCREKFAADPEHYLAPAKPQPPAPAGT